ncbi:voltage-dependent L-type calcium channel subunit alpha-1D isoform X2 [Hydra vulgaris]|uniref:Voltage-dependent L-type calcium channel subunit alpha-1D isoform X2 n=1 Tax=Hydra vulgaris TaxID=6087 RepID=A0ABM4BFU2_HYDVU
MVVMQHDVCGSETKEVILQKFEYLDSEMKELKKFGKKINGNEITTKQKHLKSFKKIFSKSPDLDLNESQRSFYKTHFSSKRSSSIKKMVATFQISNRVRKQKKEYSSLFLLSPKNKIRLLAAKITKAKLFEYFILLTIIVTCVIMALDVPLPNQDKSAMNKFSDDAEYYLIAIFASEALLKIVANGFVLHPHSYLRSLWNVIDFVVVIISIATLPQVMPNSNQVNVKSLRAVRVLRPLKFITGVPSLHIIMTSIMKAVAPLLQVLYLLSFVIGIYAIIGLEFMVERFHYTCKSEIEQLVSKPGKPCDREYKKLFFVHGFKCPNDEKCLKGDPNEINHGITTFDNIFFAIITVFQCVTTEGWSDIMYYTFSTVDEFGYIWSFYYVSLVMLGSFIMLNLVLGVLNGEFAKEKTKVDNRRKFLKLREKKKLERLFESYLNWISTGEELLVVEQKYRYDKYSLNATINPLFVFFSRKISIQKDIDQTSMLGLILFRIELLRLKARKFVKHKFFFWFVLSIVFLNTIFMTTYHFGQPQWLIDLQVKFERTFVAIFMLELLLKVFALTIKGYCRSAFNIFEFIVVFASSIEAYSPWNAGLRILRCLRLLRIFKVTRYWSRLRNLVSSLMHAMNSILSLFLLLYVYIVITALLGMQLFSGRFNELDKYPKTNFDGFSSSLLAVFQVITGEDWYSVMYNGMFSYKAPGELIGLIVSLYFLFLVAFGNYTLLNVFLAIAVDNLANAEVLIQDEEEENLLRVKKNQSENFGFDNDENAEKELKHENSCEVKKCVEPDNGYGYANTEFNKFDQKVDKEFVNSKIFIEEDFELNIAKQGFLNVLKNEVVQEKEFDGIIPVLKDSSLFIFTSTNSFRVLCHKIVQSKYFDYVIIVIIFLSSIMLSLEDPIDIQSSLNNVGRYCDYIFTAIFGIEIFLKIIDTGFILHKGSFFRESWNILDLLVFTSNLLSIIFLNSEKYKMLLTIKVLRVSRVLRPIKAIQKVKKLKIVFQCMVYSLKNVAFVLIITLLMLFIFACIGVQLFKGKSFYCNDESKRTEDECKGSFYNYDTAYESIVDILPKTEDRVWRRSGFHFDNVIEAIVTLYVCSTEDNWPTTMYQFMSVTKEKEGPLEMGSSYMALYFIVFMVIFTFLIINIYIALIILTFQKQGEKEIQGGLDKNQHDCLEYVLNCKPCKRFIPENESSLSFRVWVVVESRYFDYFTTLLIVLNTLQLMMKYNGMTDRYRNSMQTANIGFTILFVIEAFVKIIAYKLNYFKDIWNLFDLALLLGGLLDIIFTYVKQIGLDPTMFRLFRVARVLKLLRKGKRVRIMVWTLLKSLKALPYVIGLIILTSYVYALIGIQLFGNIKFKEALTEKNNFRNIYRASLLLFRCSTGDNWSVIMHECYDNADCEERYASHYNHVPNCGSTILARIYFMSYMFISMFFLLNLFVAVIMDNFEYLTRDSSIFGSHDLEDFVRCWSQFDPKATGYISHDKLYELMSYISPPIGFGVKCPKTIAYKRLIRMNMPVNSDGGVSFYTTLMSLVRVGLKICLKSDPYESDSSLKATIKFLWPNITLKTLDKFFPNLTDENQLTVGKYFCIKLFVMNFQKSKGRSNRNSLQQEAVPINSHSVIGRIHSLLPGFMHHKPSNDSYSEHNFETTSKVVGAGRNVTFSGAFTKAQHEHRQARENSISKKERNQVRRRSSWGDVSSFFRLGSSRDKPIDTAIKLENNNDVTKINLSTSISPASLSPDTTYSSTGMKSMSYNPIGRSPISNGKLLTRSNSGGIGSVHRRVINNQVLQNDDNKNLNVNSAQKQHYQYHSRNMQSISAPSTPRGSSYGNIPINFPNIDSRNRDSSPSSLKANPNSTNIYKKNGSFAYSDQAPRGYIEPSNSPYTERFNQSSPFINHNSYKSDPDVKYRLNGKINEYNDFSDFERQRSVSDSQRTYRYTNGQQVYGTNYHSVSDGILQERRDFQSRNKIPNQVVYDNMTRVDNKLDPGGNCRFYEHNRLPPDSNIHEYGDLTDQTSLSNDKSHSSYKINKQLDNSYKRYITENQPQRHSVQEISDSCYKPQLITRRDSRFDRRDRLSPNLSVPSQFYPLNDGDYMNEASQQYYEKMISQINSQIAMVTDRRPDMYNPMLVVNSEDDENEWC